MTTLPSFLQLMSSLGLDKHSPWSSPSSSAPPSPTFKTQLRPVSRDRVSPSRHRVARYSPYPLLSTRRGSLPAASLITIEIHQPMRASSTSPRPLVSTTSRRRNAPSISTNVYESTSDLTANTPISIYVRRKTPSLSPTSPTFPHEHSPTITPMPLSLPTLPSLFFQTDLYSAPPTPQPEATSEHNSYHSKFHSEISEGEGHHDPVFHHTNVRISTPTDANQLA